MRAYQKYWELLKKNNTLCVDLPAEKHHQFRVLVRREANRDVNFMRQFRGRFYISAATLNSMLRLNLVYKT